MLRRQVPDIDLRRKRHGQVLHRRALDERVRREGGSARLEPSGDCRSCRTRRGRIAPGSVDP